MKFISVKEFLSQIQSIQDEFWGWWNPEVGDLYCTLYNAYNTVLVVDKYKSNLSTFKGDIKLFAVPLFTEEQLIQFIEDKTGEVLEIIYLDCICNYRIILGKKSYETGQNSLLQALWRVACQIAQEETNNQKQNTTTIDINKQGIPVIRGGGKTMRKIYNEKYR